MLAIFNYSLGIQCTVITLYYIKSGTISEFVVDAIRLRSLEKSQNEKYKYEL